MVRILQNGILISRRRVTQTAVHTGQRSAGNWRLPTNFPPTSRTSVRKIIQLIYLYGATTPANVFDDDDNLSNYSPEITSSWK